jgi:conjugal transfer mating pair stabilization protein TraN
MNQKQKEAGAHPFYQGLSKESHYGEAELKGKAQTAATQDPAAQMVFESSDKRPQMKIDPTTDPLLKGSAQVLENPLEVIGGAGIQIVEVQQSGKTETINCEESGEDSLETCARELTVKVIKTKVIKEKISTVRLMGCKKSYKNWHTQSCTALRNQLISWRKRRIWTKNKEPFDITNTFKSCSQEGPNRCYKCNNPRNTVPKDIPLSDIKQVLIERELGGRPKIGGSTNYCSHGNLKGYDLSTTVKIIYEEESHEVLPDEWSDNCARLEEKVDSGLCGYYSRVCTQGPATRVINGVPITRDCWQETMTYACSFPAKDDCGPLRARGCAQIHSGCKQYVGNTCVVYGQTYQCNESPKTTFQIQGGNIPFCMDGNCRDQSWENNDEMMSSVAQLSILKEIQGNFKKGFLFKCSDDRCSKYILDFKDCCGSGSGWGKDIGLGGCKAKEKLLNKRRRAGICHRVGTYCAEKILGQCVKKKTTFCCFGSKLLKVFHEQGRKQINMGWGSPESPLCRGFTIAEIQRIDFSKLDLREVFEEIMKNYKPGKMGDIGRQVGDRLEVIKKGMIPNVKQPQTPQRASGA